MTKRTGGRRPGYEHAQDMKGRPKSIVRRWRAEALNGHDELPLALDMEAFLEARAVLNYSPRTLDGLRVSLRSFLLWAEPRGLHQAEHITRPMLESYQRWLWRFRKANGEPLGISTQCNRLTAVKDLFSWLCKQNRLHANPAADLDLPRAVHRLPQRALGHEELRAVFALPDVGDPLGLRDRALLELLYSTGIRRGEAASLRIGEIDFGRAVLFVNQGKGHKDRYVPVGRRALFWLRRYLDAAWPVLVASPSEQAVFLSAYGEGMSRGSLGNRVKKLLVDAGVNRPGGCHLFRHSCATHLLEGGADIRFIQQILGHAKLETTAVYTQVSIEQLQAVHSRCHPAEKLKK